MKDSLLTWIDGSLFAAVSDSGLWTAQQVIFPLRPFLHLFTEASIVQMSLRNYSTPWSAQAWDDDQPIFGHA